LLVELVARALLGVPADADRVAAPFRLAAHFACDQTLQISRAITSCWWAAGRFGAAPRRWPA
jgi:hypothetical protein